jgi:serine O-acetyltransferase
MDRDFMVMMGCERDDTHLFERKHSENDFIFSQPVDSLPPSANHPHMQTEVENLWDTLIAEAEKAVEQEPVLKTWLHSRLLRHANLAEAIARNLAETLDFLRDSDDYLYRVFRNTLEETPSIQECIRADIVANFERDPACHNHFNPLLNYKGFKAITGQRIAHALWQNGSKNLALHLQSLISEIYSVDIHPAAKIGKGILLDHATGFVAGETAVIGDDVSIFQGVTLGGTGKEDGDRHPKVEYGVLIGAGAKILGNIRIGHCSKIGANSVVLHDVPPRSTVVGVPGKIIGTNNEAMPSRNVDHCIL